MRRQSFSRAELFPMRCPGLVEYLVMHNLLLAIATRHKAGLNAVLAQAVAVIASILVAAEGMSLNSSLPPPCICVSVVLLYQRVADS